MPISSLVLTLAPDSTHWQRTVEALAEVPYLSLGEVGGQKIPAVLDAPDRQENKKTLRQLESLSGVSHVDVVFVSLEDAGESESSPSIGHLQKPSFLSWE